MLDGIDTPVGGLDHLVESDEGGLQGCQLHQQVDGFLIICLILPCQNIFCLNHIHLQSFQLLPTFCQPCKLIRISTVLGEKQGMKTL